MARRSSFPLLTGIFLTLWFAGMICALVFRLEFDAGTMILASGGIALMATWLVFGLTSSISHTMRPQKAKVASEAKLFEPLMELTAMKNGTFQMVGRAARATFNEAAREYVVTARAGCSKEQLVVSSALFDTDFCFEISDQRVSRKDLTTFQTGDPDLDQRFSCAANDVERARQTIQDAANVLLKLDADVTLATKHGQLELKRGLFRIDEEVTEDTLEAFQDLHRLVDRAQIDQPTTA